MLQLLVITNRIVGIILTILIMHEFVSIIFLLNIKYNINYKTLYYDFY